MSAPAIGGYFELELPPQRSSAFPGALRFQSARAAFFALLQAGRPDRVWMPDYLCDSMLAPLHAAGVTVMPYEVDARFEVSGQVDLQADDWFYAVNYFGVRTREIDALLARVDPARVVLDHCQAFYVPAPACLASIYSPRKFFGVADGGFLVTDLPVPAPQQDDTPVLEHAGHLLMRLAGAPEIGYAAYQRSEQALAALAPRHMSALSERILGSVDLEAARERRKRNFDYLHRRLARFNGCDLDPGSIDGPLCYPSLTGAQGLREALIAQRIYVATYWPDVLQRAPGASAAAALVRELVPLPCDQRYDEDDMARVADACAAYLSAHTHHTGTHHEYPREDRHPQGSGTR